MYRYFQHRNIVLGKSLFGILYGYLTLPFLDSSQNQFMVICFVFEGFSSLSTNAIKPVKLLFLLFFRASLSLSYLNTNECQYFWQYVPFMQRTLSPPYLDTTDCQHFWQPRHHIWIPKKTRALATQVSE